MLCVAGRPQDSCSSIKSSPTQKLKCLSLRSGEAEDTRIKIDWLRGAGTFDEHGQFDPNNPKCIALPWTVTNVKAIFKLVRLEYNKAMEQYTMGTGKFQWVARA